MCCCNTFITIQFTSCRRLLLGTRCFGLQNRYRMSLCMLGRGGGGTHHQFWNWQLQHLTQHIPLLSDSINRTIPVWNTETGIDAGFYWGCVPLFQIVGCSKEKNRQPNYLPTNALAFLLGVLIFHGPIAGPGGIAPHQPTTIPHGTHDPPIGPSPMEYPPIGPSPMEHMTHQ